MGKRKTEHPNETTQLRILAKEMESGMKSRDEIHFEGRGDRDREGSRAAILGHFSHLKHRVKYSVGQVVTFSAAN